MTDAPREGGLIGNPSFDSPSKTDVAIIVMRVGIIVSKQNAIIQKLIRSDQKPSLQEAAEIEKEMDALLAAAIRLSMGQPLNG